MRTPRRVRVGDLAVALASTLLLLAVVVGYLEHAFADSDQFANRATTALRDDDVRDLVAERVTDELVLDRGSDLLAARPLVLDVTSGLVGSRAFTSLLRPALADVHRTLFADGQDTVTLAVADVGTLVAAALERVDPNLAEAVPAREPARLAAGDIGDVPAAAADVLQRVAVLGWLLAALALVLVLTILGTAQDRRRSVGRLGAGVAIAGIILLVALTIARSAVTGGVGGADEQAAARGVWDAFLGDLRVIAG